MSSMITPTNVRILPMKLLEQRATAARKHSGLTQAEAARQIGVSREAVSQWENGKTKNINSSLLHSAAEVYGVSAQWLATGRGGMLNDGALSNNDQNQLSPTTIKIQHLSAVGGMGSMISLDVDHDSEITTIELTKQYLASRVGKITNPVNLKIISGMGDSMRPTFQSGDTLFVDIGVNEFITEATYVIHYDNSIWIKNLARDGNGGYLVMSANSAYPTVTAKKDDPTFRIIGMVIAVLNLNTLI